MPMLTCGHDGDDAADDDDAADVDDGAIAGPDDEHDRSSANSKPSAFACASPRELDRLLCMIEVHVSDLHSKPPTSPLPFT